MRNCQLWLTMHEKTTLLQKCGLRIWLCLFMFPLIMLKQLHSLTSIETLSCLVGVVVTLQTEVRKSSRVRFLALARIFMFAFLVCCCCVFTFLSKKHYWSWNFAIPNEIFIHLVNFTYCKMCDFIRVSRYRPSIFNETLNVF